MVVPKKQKLNKNKNIQKTPNQNKNSKSVKRNLLTLKDFNFFDKITTQNCNTNQTPIANSLDSCSFTQNESMNINLNYTQSANPNINIEENIIIGDKTETHLGISKLILEKSITQAKIQCAISNYVAQIKSITNYKNNPESAEIPVFLKVKIQNLLKSKLAATDIQQDIDRTLISSLNSKQLKLLELENLNRNFVVNFWNETLLPALHFANYAMNYDTLVSLYSSTLKNTKFEFFLVQKKHEIRKSEKIKKIEIIKEENMQQIILTKGDLNKLANNFNQLSLKVNKTHLENLKLKSQIKSINSKNSINSKKDLGRKALIKNKSTGQNKQNYSKRNGNKQNIVASKKYPSKISFS